MNQETFPSSDEDDVDYNPEGEGSDLPSEAESEGEEEDCHLSGEENETAGKKRKKNIKRRRKKFKKSQKSESAEQSAEEENIREDVTEEEMKKKSDSLWADFTKDVGVPKKTLTNGDETSDGTLTEKDSEKDNVTVTKVFEFAGEEIRVEKQVPVTSIEGQSSVRSRGRGSGLSAVLGQIGKKSKIGTLEKSKLDWDRYKKNEGLEEELQIHNRGKHGYLEKQDFLQRTDVRQFEIEKDLRMKKRSNR